MTGRWRMPTVTAAAWPALAGVLLVGTLPLEVAAMLLAVGLLAAVAPVGWMARPRHVPEALGTEGRTGTARAGLPPCAVVMRDPDAPGRGGRPRAPGGRAPAPVR
ncbi:MAG: hypothetical protein ACFCVF_16915 [Kineosporiaceae bacterium]